MLLFVDFETPGGKGKELHVWYPRLGETEEQLKARAQAEQAEMRGVDVVEWDGRRRKARGLMGQRSPYGNGTEAGKTGKRSKRWGT